MTMSIISVLPINICTIVMLIIETSHAACRVQTGMTAKDETLSLCLVAKYSQAECRIVSNDGIHVSTQRHIKAAAS